MKPTITRDEKAGNRHRTTGRNPVYRTGFPVLAALSVAGPIAWLNLPSAQVKTGYTVPAGPDPRR